MKSSVGEQLAIFGGPRTLEHRLTPYRSIGAEELEAAKAVIESGVLSRFLGCWDEDFYGGSKVREFERAWEKHFQVPHAVSVNSATSGLIAALGAIGIEPGDEVIVTPWTMCATATAILHWNAIPVFADIEAETFCLDPVSVEANITPWTKAIVATDIFGQTADIEALSSLAKRNGLKLISDTAQAPGARWGSQFAGTLADIGVFSLNYHKHIHTGEGGVAVTADANLAERLQLIRNHAEAVVAGKGVTDLSNMVGHNFRLGEIESAIGIEQLKKLDVLVQRKQRAAARLNVGLQGLRGLRTPIVRPGATHVYYFYPMVLDPGISRSVILRALEAEGIDCLTGGYVNVHLFPMYQQRVAYGSKGFPWTSQICHRHVSYDKGICPVAEKLHEETFLGLELCVYEFDDQAVDLVVQAFQKVWSRLDDLHDLPTV